MPRISALFSDKYLTSKNFAGGSDGVVFTIEGGAMKRVGNQRKLVLSVADADGEVFDFPLNKTNAQNIAKMHGDDSDSWNGKAICIYPDTTEYDGEERDCLRVRAVKAEKRSK